MKKPFLLILILCFCLSLFAQHDSIQIKPFQLTFFYPIGSAGANSVKNGYYGSVNILTGITGAANGFELAGLVNINRLYNEGFQVAGISNINGSYTKGTQLSGICNINGSYATGFQVAGIGNIVGGNVHGFQLGGLLNVSGGNVKGGTIAGLANLSGDLDGVAFAGVLNSNIDSVKGAQIAGIANLTGNADGCQLAGITSVSSGDAVVQISGIGNIATKVEGIQLGGIFNMAETVHGVQLAGIINICDSIDGVPLALISIVRKNGYRRFEIWGGETFYANISYKIGVRDIYTIFTLGYHPGVDRNLGFGVGLGSIMQLKGKNSLELEGYIYDINHYFSMNYGNQYFMAKLNYVRNLNERLAIFAGPTFNYLLGESADDVAPNYRVENNDWLNTSYWVGFNAGFRF